MIQLFVATKAFIEHDGKILILRESNRYAEGTNANRYGMPGGRVKPGEPFDQSLVREIKEETGLTVTLGAPFYVGEWRPVVSGQQWQIVGIFFSCQAESDGVTLSEDHNDFVWISPTDADKHNLIPNLLPAFKAFSQIKKAAR